MRASREPKTTEAHFRAFRRNCKEFLAMFGMTDWRVSYRHGISKGNFGMVEYDLDDKVAVITLSTKWSKLVPLDGDELRKTAFHEVCHLLLSSVVSAAESRYGVTPDRLEKLEHEIIHRLESLVNTGKI